MADLESSRFLGLIGHARGNGGMTGVGMMGVVSKDAMRGRPTPVSFGAAQRRRLRRNCTPGVSGSPMNSTPWASSAERSLANVPVRVSGISCNVS